MDPIVELSVDLDGAPYPLLIGKGAIGVLPERLSELTKNRKLILVYDDFFRDSIAKDLSDALSMTGFDVLLHEMPAGKGNKNINEALRIYAKLEENDFARDSTLVALGGGVIGDLAGFIASTWLRGMNLVHIPTTLLSMVDSSIGGKTAINFRHTINGIGSYYHPILNFIDLNLVDSLSDRDYRSGLAEVIKCAIINDRNFYQYILDEHKNILSRNHDDVIKFIRETIQIKIRHVQGDVKEGGKRLLLNYGHTLGHAVEISTVDKDNHEQLRHGEGVSIGIMAVSYIAEKYLGTDKSVSASFDRIFDIYGLPKKVIASELGFEREKLISSCIRNVVKDKKRINNNLRLILASEIGKASVFNDVPFDFVEAAFHRIIEA